MERTPIRRSQIGLVAKKKIKARSRRNVEEFKAAAEARRAYREDHPYCEIGYIVAISEGSADWCTLLTQGLHERKKRSQQGSLSDIDNLMAACNPCNGWVENNPKLAQRLGLVVLSYQEPSEVFVYRGGK